MSIVRSARGCRRWLARRLQGFASTERGLARLEASDRAPIATAFRCVLEGRSTEEEARWFRRIEGLRAELLSRRDTIETLDFGAGSPERLRPAAHAERGEPVSGTIAHFCTASKAPRWQELLFRLVLAIRPERCLELGTSLGISAAYQGAALEIAREGRLLTIEGSPAKAEIARGNLALLGIERVEVRSGRFHDLLDGVLEELGVLQYVFIDGHHDESATLAYFERIAPRLADGSLAVFDDIRWSGGMLRAWRRIQADERIRCAIDCHGVGIAVIDREPGRRETFRIAID